MEPEGLSARLRLLLIEGVAVAGGKRLHRVDTAETVAIGGIELIRRNLNCTWVAFHSRNVDLRSLRSCVGALGNSYTNLV